MLRRMPRTLCLLNDGGDLPEFSGRQLWVKHTFNQGGKMRALQDSSNSQGSWAGPASFKQRHREENKSEPQNPISEALALQIAAAAADPGLAFTCPVWKDSRWQTDLVQHTHTESAITHRSKRWIVSSHFFVQGSRLAHNTDNMGNRVW